MATIKVYRKDYLEGYVIDENDLSNWEEGGYTSNYQEAYDASFSTGGSNYTSQPADAAASQINQTGENATELSQALFSYFPEEVQKEYAKGWIKYGEPTLALAETRNSTAWKNEFGHLKRPDGSLRMSELESLSVKATYKETLSEVGITDFKDFEDNFNILIKNDVSAAEFQDRIDLVWTSVKDNIPQVEQLFRERFDIDTNTPTIFAALINPTIQDKLLKGEIKGLGVAAEAKVAGFTNTFEHFDALAKAGLTQQGARELYGAASGIIGMGQQTGTAIGLEAIEQAAVGDEDAKKQLQLLGAESKSMSSFAAGPAKKDGKVSGLLET